MSNRLCRENFSTVWNIQKSIHSIDHIGDNTDRRLVDELLSCWHYRTKKAQFDITTFNSRWITGHSIVLLFEFGSPFLIIFVGAGGELTSFNIWIYFQFFDAYSHNFFCVQFSLSFAIYASSAGISALGLICSVENLPAKVFIENLIDVNWLLTIAHLSNQIHSRFVRVAWPLFVPYSV